MNAETIVSFGKIAGIGGIALGVFLFIFQDVLKKVALTSLTKEQSFRFIMTFMILVWTIALSGIGAWVYGNYINISTQPMIIDRAGDAQTVISSLTSGDFDAIYARFSEGNKRELPPHKIAKAWNAIVVKLGPPKAITKPRQTVYFGRTAYVATYEGTKGNASVFVGFTAQGDVDLLWFDWRQ